MIPGQRARKSAFRSSSGHCSVARDQTESAFAVLLSALLARVPGARAAALVDCLGETVDYAGLRDPFGVRVAAAHLRLVLDHVRAQAALASTVSMAVCASRASFVVRALPEGYAVVLVLTRGAGLFASTGRALATCARQLGEEAGWPPQDPYEWYAVDAVSDHEERPTALRFDGGSETIEVIGRLTGGLRRWERGWRVRTGAGIEAMLVREPGGFWYADEPMAPRQTR